MVCGCPLHFAYDSWLWCDSCTALLGETLVYRARTNGGSGHHALDCGVARGSTSKEYEWGFFSASKVSVVRPGIDPAPFEARIDHGGTSPPSSRAGNRSGSAAGGNDFVFETTKISRRFCPRGCARLSAPSYGEMCPDRRRRIAAAGRRVVTGAGAPRTCHSAGLAS